MTEEIESQLPVFLKKKWLDSVCLELEWKDIFVQDKKSGVRAIFRYCYKSKYGFRIICLPQLTPYLGIYFLDEVGSFSGREKYRIQDDLIAQVIEKLPEFDKFDLFFHPSIDNWMPFYKAGYQQTSFYTYEFSDLKSLDAIKSGYSHTKRKEVRRASRIGYVTLINEIDYGELYNFHQETLNKQGKDVSYSRSVLENIDKMDPSRDFSSVIEIQNPSGLTCAMALVVYDEVKTYSLITVVSQNEEKNGLYSFLFQQIFEFASRKSSAFDFEGSMIPAVEVSFRQYGATRKSYFRISQLNSPLLKVLDAKRNIFGGK